MTQSILAEDGDISLLTSLLEAGDQFISGQSLADSLGVSRVSIWNRMKKLETEGFRFEAIRNRGYRLEQEPAQIHAALISAYLKSREFSYPIYAYPTIDSTSSECERLLIAGTPPPFCVISAEQTRGRGRMGRDWHSENVGNLYLSFGFQPNLPLARMQTFTLWLGIHIAAFIRDFTGLDMKIKWPNDLMLEGRKVAGMLTEARIDNDHMRDLIFGLGINFNAPAASFPPELREKAISLAMVLGRNLPLHAFSAQLIQSVFNAYEKFHQGVDDQQLLEKWKPFDLLRNRQVVVTTGRSTVEGTVKGIDSQGSLVLIEADGSPHRLRAGDVSLQTNY